MAAPLHHRRRWRRNHWFEAVMMGGCGQGRFAHSCQAGEAPDPVTKVEFATGDQRDSSAARLLARSSSAFGKSMSRRSVNSVQYTALMISATGA